MNLSKIKTILFLFLFVGNSTVFASSYSSNYSVNDEAIDFAHNTDYLQSSSYNMDLSGIFWTDRPSESTSFTVVDSNSGLIAVVPPTPPSGGGGGSGGGFVLPDPGETDTAIIGDLPIEEDQPDLDLHEAAEEEPLEVEPFVPIIPEPVSKPVQVGLVYDDFDGCSAQFEMKYMSTNPYRSDTDKDGVEDCDEDWIYDTNPIIENDNFIHAGIARAEDFIYTQPKPLFVGRADFGIQDSYTENHTQLSLELVDPTIEMGMFFLDLKDDLNCVGISDLELESNNYQGTLYRDGEKQEFPNQIIVDLEKKYDVLKINIPEAGMLNHDNGMVSISGSTGADYGVVALWVSDKYIDVSATVADYKGDYYLPSPRQLEDGDYSIYVYAIYKLEDKLVQTNYHVLSVKMKDGIPYIVEKVEEKEPPHWKAAVEFAKTQISEQKIEALHESANKTNPMYLLSYGILLIIAIISFYIVWIKEN